MPFDRFSTILIDTKTQVVFFYILLPKAFNRIVGFAIVMTKTRQMIKKNRFRCYDAIKLCVLTYGHLDTSFSTEVAVSVSKNK